MRTCLAAALALSATGMVVGQPVYPFTPDWESLDPHHSTGAALVDLDRDGALDLVVADGNDIAVGRLNVYYNDGAGNFPIMRTGSPGTSPTTATSTSPT